MPVPIGGAGLPAAANAVVECWVVGMFDQKRSVSNGWYRVFTRAFPESQQHHLEQMQTAMVTKITVWGRMQGKKKEVYVEVTINYQNNLENKNICARSRMHLASNQ